MASGGRGPQEKYHINDHCRHYRAFFFLFFIKESTFFNPFYLAAVTVINALVITTCASSHLSRRTLRSK